MPAVIPFTNPVADPTVATDVLPLIHVPPGVVDVSVVVRATHRPRLPVMLAGVALTVIDLVTAQPAPREYVIVTVPEITPLTIPDREPAVAIDVLLLVQRPPGTALVSVTVAPAQTVAGPVMADGLALTVIVLVV